jgi:hypothetical protein
LSEPAGDPSVGQVKYIFEGEKKGKMSFEELIDILEEKCEYIEKDLRCLLMKAKSAC